MQLATMDDIVHLKVDHKLGSLVNSNTGKKATLSDFRIVYARYGKKMFKQNAAGKWSMMCSSGDAVTGTSAKGDTLPCGSSVICSDCKPFLTLGLRTEAGRLATLEVSASVAKVFSDSLSVMSRLPIPVYAPVWKISVMKTEKSSDMTYAQVVLRERVGVEMDDQAIYLEARTRLARVIDQRMDRTPGQAKPSLGGASLKM